MIRLIGLDYDWTMLDYSSGKPVLGKQLITYLGGFIRAGGFAGIVSGRTAGSLRDEFARHGVPWHAPFPSFCVVQEAFVFYDGAAVPDAYNEQARADMERQSEVLASFLPGWLEAMRSGGCSPVRWSLSSDYLLSVEFSCDREAERAHPILKDAVRRQAPACGVHRNCHLLGVYLLSCGKGNALARVAEHFDVSTQQVLAVGDGLNDLTMMEEKFGFLCGAPENADPLLLERVRDRGGRIGAGSAYTGVMDVLRQYRADGLLPYADVGGD